MGLQKEARGWLQKGAGGLKGLRLKELLGVLKDGLEGGA